MRLWFTPTAGHVDLADAREAITGARRALLFLMFNPGPRETLLNAILDVARADHADARLYIRGVLNQDPSSATNDENLLIIRDAPDLAAAYATNIMAIYHQHRWRYRCHIQPLARRWKGLADNDRWQHHHLKADGPALREIDFWVDQ
jgi:hypothetical protein